MIGYKFVFAVVVLMFNYFVRQFKKSGSPTKIDLITFVNSTCNCNITLSETKPTNTTTNTTALMIVPYQKNDNTMILIACIVFVTIILIVRRIKITIRETLVLSMLAFVSPSTAACICQNDNTVFCDGEGNDNESDLPCFKELTRTTTNEPFLNDEIVFIIVAIFVLIAIISIGFVVYCCRRRVFCYRNASVDLEWHYGEETPLGDNIYDQIGNEDGEQQQQNQESQQQHQQQEPEVETNDDFADANAGTKDEGTQCGAKIERITEITG